MTDVQQIYVLLKEASVLMTSEKKTDRHKAAFMFRQICNISETIALTLKVKK